MLTKNLVVESGSLPLLISKPVTGEHPEPVSQTVFLTRIWPTFFVYPTLTTFPVHVISCIQHSNCGM